MPTTAGTITHRYVVTGANSGASQISKDRYNDSFIVAAGSNGDILVRDSGQTDGWGWQTVLPVVNGGSGRATLTNHGVLVGAGTGAVTQLAVGVTGTVLAGATGADPAFTASPALTSISLPSSNTITVVSASIKLTSTSSFGVGAVSIGDWNVDNAGEFTPFSTNSRDVGSSALKVRSVYCGTSVITPAVTIASATLTLSTTTSGDIVLTAAGAVKPNLLACFSRTAKVISTAYQAPCDGFFEGIVSGTGTVTDFAGYSDSSNPPTTLRTSIQQLDSGIGPFSGGWLMAVKKGDYYEAKVAGATGAPTYTLNWIPLGTAG